MHAYLPKEVPRWKRRGMDLLHDVATGNADAKVREMSALESARRRDHAALYCRQDGDRALESVGRGHGGVCRTTCA